MEIDKQKVKAAAIFLEELNISGDTMVKMDCNIDELPLNKIGSYYLHDILCMYCEYNNKKND